MLGKVVVVVGAGAALLLGSRRGKEQVARLTARSRAGYGRGSTTPALVDRRPQAALEDGAGHVPALLPDATAGEVALAVTTDQVRPV